METTVWKEKCIGNKPNIYTSIQCVVSRGATLGELGTLQSGDCTQWGIHSRFPLKWSQTDRRVRADSFVTQIVPVDRLFYAGLPSWATSCLTELISTTTVWLQNRGVSTNSGCFPLLRSRVGCYVSTYCASLGLVDEGQSCSELLPLVVTERSYWSVRCRIGHERVRSQRHFEVVWETHMVANPREGPSSLGKCPRKNIYFLLHNKSTDR